MKTTAFQTLRLLADGNFHSGETMARALGVTRSAVWYGIREITGAGFQVEKVHGRGYRLERAVSLLDAERIRRDPGVHASGIALEICDTVDSTNTQLMLRAAQGARSGLALAAETQTAGRGRRGRVWQSGIASTLTFSLLWRFTQGARELAGLSLAVGVALARVLRTAGARDAQLKWPNDVVLPGGKLAGILIEMQGDVLGPSAAVIGIGINVRADPRVLAAVDQPVADLETAIGMPVDRNQLLAALLVELAAVLEQFATGGFAPLRREWQALHAHQDQRVCLTLPDGRQETGHARGVAEDGVLLLETAAGVMRHHSGEVSLRSLGVSGMNILAIDIGNTRIKWGFSESGTWLRQGWVKTDSAGALAAEFAGLPVAQRTVISNVAGAALRAQVAAALNPAAPQPLWIASAATQCGVSSGYAAPETLGPDRWAALIGAWQLMGTACVVVNVGTTMTVDALSAEGVFLGGCIVPGATLMRNALARDTANLAARDGAFSYFPDNTGDAIFSGAVNALAGAVERMVRYLEESAGNVPPVLLSGGGAALIEKRLNAAVTVVDNLVLEGLLQIALQLAGQK